MIDLSKLNKTENGGFTPEGRLSASEFNTLVKGVVECQENIVANQNTLQSQANTDADLLKRIWGKSETPNYSNDPIIFVDIYPKDGKTVATLLKEYLDSLCATSASVPTCLVRLSIYGQTALLLNSPINFANNLWSQTIIGNLALQEGMIVQSNSVRTFTRVHNGTWGEWTDLNQHIVNLIETETNRAQEAEEKLNEQINEKEPITSVTIAGIDTLEINVRCAWVEMIGVKLGKVYQYYARESGLSMPKYYQYYVTLCPNPQQPITDAQMHYFVRQRPLQGSWGEWKEVESGMSENAVKSLVNSTAVTLVGNQTLSGKKKFIDEIEVSGWDSISSKGVSLESELNGLSNGIASSVKLLGNQTIKGQKNFDDGLGISFSKLLNENNVSLEQVLGKKLEDAPTNGKQYVRQGGSWKEVKQLSFYSESGSTAFQRSKTFQVVGDTARFSNFSFFVSVQDKESPMERSDYEFTNKGLFRKETNSVGEGYYLPVQEPDNNGEEQIMPYTDRGSFVYKQRIMIDTAKSKKINLPRKGSLLRIEGMIQKTSNGQTSFAGLDMGIFSQKERLTTEIDINVPAGVSYRGSVVAVYLGEDTNDYYYA